MGLQIEGFQRDAKNRILKLGSLRKLPYDSCMWQCTRSLYRGIKLRFRDIS